MEPRMLFDGAAAVSHEVIDRPDLDHAPWAEAAAPAQSSAPLVAPQLIVIDASVEDRATLLAGLPADGSVQVLEIAAQEDGLRALAARMAGQTFSSVHVMSHGERGELRLGSRVIDAANLESFSGEWTQIGAGLTQSGDLLLYGCEIGQAEQGASFLQALARATQADVAASTNLTGAARLGGDWTLEARTGDIEAVLPFDAAAIEQYDHVLAAAPSATITAASQQALIGDAFTFNVTFDNTDVTDTGFGPYINLFVPFNGRDSNGSQGPIGSVSREGVTITGATYLGQALTVTEITLTSTDIANSTVSGHPYFRDTGGNSTISIPAGLQAGDKLYVVQLPFGSVTPGQPPVDIAVQGQLGSFADVGQPLDIRVQGGFRYGNDPLDNPASDPSLQGAIDTLTINPSLYTVTTTYIGPESETATGANYLRGYRIDVNVANGQTLTNLQISQILQDEANAQAGLRYVAIAGTPSAISGVSIGAAPGGSWTNVNGVLVSQAASATTTPSVDGGGVALTNGGTISRTISSITGSSDTIDASMVVQFYVPELDAASGLILNASTQDSTFWNVDTELTANWTPNDADDVAPAISYNSDTAEPAGYAHRLEAEALAIQKTATIIAAANPGRLTPTDTIEYVLRFQVSDYAAFNDLVLTDLLSDGQTFDGSFTPTFSVFNDGAISGSFSPAHYTISSVAANSTGVGTPDSPNYFDTQGGVQNTASNENRTRVVFRVSDQLVASSASANLVGDRFNGAPQSGATLGEIRFRVTVNQAYVDRPQGAGANLDLNEGDTVENSATADGAVLDASLAQTGNREFDDTSTRLRIDPNAVDLQVYARNGSTDNTNNRLSQFVPGDTVTYRLRYELPTGDFDNFNLAAFLPLPILNTVDANGDGVIDSDLVGGGALNNFSLDATASAAPAAGQYKAGPTHFGGITLPSTGGVSTDASSNGIVFDFGSRNDPSSAPRQVDILFTVRSADRPFADGLFLTALAQQDSDSTPGTVASTQDIDQIQLTAPVLNLTKGVVRDDVSGVTTFTRQFLQDDSATIVTETTIVGTAGTATGLATALNSANRASLDTDLRNVDDSDTVRYAVVIENTGEADSGAFDVSLRDALPAGYVTTDVSNFRITRGDGLVIYDGSSFAGIINATTGAAFISDFDVRAAFFGSDGIEFVDASATQGAIGPGRDTSGAAITSGSNIVAITYDLFIAGAEAGLVMESSATLFNYAGQDGGLDYTRNPDTSVETDLSEEATITIARAAVDKTVVATSLPNDVSSGSNVVIGEYVTYEVVITVPQGGHDAAVFRDSLLQGGVAGQVFVSVDSITFSSNVASSVGSGAAIRALANDNNTADGSGIFTDGGQEDRGLVIDFGLITNGAADNAVAETITIRYTTLVVNRSSVQDGVGLVNTAQLSTNTGLPNQIVQATNTATVTVREPAWTIAVTPDNASADFNDEVTFTVTVTGGGSAPGFTGEIPNIVLPSGLTYVAGSFELVSASGGVNTTVDAVNRSATIDRLDAGETAVFRLRATVDGGVTLGSNLQVPVGVRYSSLPDDPNNTGTLSSLLSSNEDSERTGADGVGGALNDYARVDTGSVLVVADQPVLTIVQTSEPATTANAGNPLSPQSAENIPVAVGEVVRYRAIVRMPEASALNAEFRVALPPGLVFLNDGSTTVAFVSDAGGLVSTTLSGPGLDQADGTADGSPSTAADIRAVRPSFVLANSGSDNAIANGTLNPSGSAGTSAASFSAGDDIRLLLGIIDNVNDDADGEWIVVEFNAAVVNQLSNQDALGGVPSATALPVSFGFVAGGSLQGTSDTDTVTVGEPILTGADKRVVSVSGNTVTFEVSITNSGSEEAHNLRIFDDFAGATNLTLASVLGGTLPPGATDSSTASAVDVSLDVLNPGQTITFRYTATVGDALQAVPSRDAVFSATSLSTGGTTLTVRQGADASGAPIAGVATSSSPGERSGADGPGPEASTLNNYAARDGAGLGVITGRLWDDTLDYDQAIDTAPSENLLQGVTINLTWAGADNTFGTGDDQSFSTTTDSSGRYTFGMLNAGQYRVDAPVAPTDATSGALLIYMDRANGSTAATGAAGQDGRITLTLTDGTSAADRDFGYVKSNATPTITAPATRTGDEDTSFSFTGPNQIQIADPDLAEGANPSPLPNNFLTTLTVTNGVLNVSPTAGVTITGNGTAAVSLTGAVADINTALTSLTYQPTSNYAGSATLTVRVDDRGNIGDADGDRVPNETVQDNLFANQSINLTVAAVNDPLDANPDLRTIAEPNPGPGSTVVGNVILGGQPGEQADVDIDGDPINIQGAVVGNVPGIHTSVIPVTVAGTYGSVQFNADGSYVYTPNANAQTIRAGQVVDDVFTYSINDGNGNQASTTLTIRITGANDPPQANPDANTIAANATSARIGNVLGSAAPNGTPGDATDTDPDTGDVLAVQGVVAGNNPATHTTGLGTPITGTYGSVTLNSNGTYGYTVNTLNPTLIALRPGQSVTDVFSYTINDGNGGVSTSTLTITINGANDPPAGTDRVFTVTEDNPVNLVPADFGFSDPDTGDQFKAVRIDTLPASGQLVLNGSPVVAGQLIQWAQVNSLQYVPAPNANNDTLGASPSFTFTVCDDSGDPATQFDPLPNRITFNLVPDNDPPTAPTITVTIDQSATLGTPASLVGPVSPAPSDPDEPLQTLTITVDSLPPLSSGQVLLSDGTPVVVGQTLTQAQLQSLAFVPNPNDTTPTGTNGLIPAGSLGFTVSDGNGGSADGAIIINVRPSVVVPPPRLVPPIVLIPPVPPAPPPGPVPPPGLPPLTERLRLEDPRLPNDFDPFVPWYAGPPIAGAERVAAANEKVAEATKPVVQVKDDCVPEPKAKVKPKPVAVKRSVFASPLTDSAKPFSEQVQAAKKRFKPPAKVVPKAAPAREC